QDVGQHLLESADLPGGEERPLAVAAGGQTLGQGVEIGVDADGVVLQADEGADGGFFHGWVPSAGTPDGGADVAPLRNADRGAGVSGAIVGCRSRRTGVSSTMGF